MANHLAGATGKIGASGAKVGGVAGTIRTAATRGTRAEALVDGEKILELDEWAGKIERVEGMEEDGGPDPVRRRSDDACGDR